MATVLRPFSAQYARDKLSRSADPACLEGLKRLWGCEHVGEAREALGAWVVRSMAFGLMERDPGL